MQMVIQKFPNGWSFEVLNDQVRVWNEKGICVTLRESGDVEINADHAIKISKADSQNLIIC